MKRSKRYRDISKLVDKKKMYSLDEAIELLKKTSTAKYNESVELHVKLGIDPKRSDQIVRGSVLLPHGTGKERKVAVIAGGEKLKEAELSGADFFGSEELISKIEKGWLEFDVLVATPDMMKSLSRLGKMLGPRGLMPNPKTGTVTMDIRKAVSEIKRGRIEFKNDSYGIIHAVVGKVNFKNEQLKENIKVFIDNLISLKPAGAKGQYIRSISISSSHGVGIKVSPLEFSKAT